jgi:hypothetical protein
MNNGINKTLDKLFQKIVPAQFEWVKLSTMLTSFGAKIKVDKAEKHAWIRMRNGRSATFGIGHHHFLEGKAQVMRFRKFINKNGIHPQMG